MTLLTERKRVNLPFSSAAVKPLIRALGSPDVQVTGIDAGPPSIFSTNNDNFFLFSNRYES